MSSDLYFFNPTCEMAVANGEVSYMPPNHLKRFEEDLETVPLYFTSPKDMVLVRNAVSDMFLDHLHKCGFPMPSFVRLGDEIASESISLQSINPWGWSPAVHRILAHHKLLVDPAWMKYPMSQWNSDQKLLLSRVTGYKLAEMLVNIGLGKESGLEIPELPLKLNSMEEIAGLSSRLTPPVMLKAPWSASGRGLFKIRDENEHPELSSWVKGKMKQQGFLYAEPFLSKVQDLSFHFFISGTEIRFIGITFFRTDSSGQFTGCYTYQPVIDGSISSIPEELLICARDLLVSAMKKLELPKYYNGPVGIDAMLFINAHGQLKLHPCIEVNLRYTMGLLNLNLVQKLHPQSRGFWQIGRMTFENWRLLANSKKIEFRDGMPAHGIIALTPPPLKEGFVSWLELNYQGFNL
jgi:hypothetical protein